MTECMAYAPRCSNPLCQDCIHVGRCKDADTVEVFWKAHEAEFFTSRHFKDAPECVYAADRLDCWYRRTRMDIVASVADQVEKIMAHWQWEQRRLASLEKRYMEERAVGAHVNPPPQP